MKRPAEVYRPSDRRLPEPLPELHYPLHDDVLTVSNNGHIRLPRGRQVFLSNALVHQPVGLREEHDGRWLVTFANLDLGAYDPKTGFFLARFPASSGGNNLKKCHPCTRTKTSPMYPLAHTLRVCVTAHGMR